MYSSFVSEKGIVNLKALYEELELADPSSVNHGVYDGVWRAGRGPIVESYNPSTNEVIGKVQVVSQSSGLNLNGRFKMP